MFRILIQGLTYWVHIWQLIQNTNMFFFSFLLAPNKSRYISTGALHFEKIKILGVLATGRLGVNPPKK